MQVPNLPWQTKLPLPVGPSLLLSGLATWAALADNATWMQLVGAGRTGQLKGLPAQPAAPRLWGLSFGVFPQGVAGGSRSPLH